MQYDCEKKKVSFLIKKIQVECFGRFGNSKPLKKIATESSGKQTDGKEGSWQAFVGERAIGRAGGSKHL